MGGSDGGQRILFNCHQELKDKKSKSMENNSKGGNESKGTKKMILVE